MLVSFHNTFLFAYHLLESHNPQFACPSLFHVLFSYTDWAIPYFLLRQSEFFCPKDTHILSFMVISYNKVMIWDVVIV